MMDSRKKKILLGISISVAVVVVAIAVIVPTVLLVQKKKKNQQEKQEELNNKRIADAVAKTEKELLEKSNCTDLFSRWDDSLKICSSSQNPTDKFFSLVKQSRDSPLANNVVFKRSLSSNQKEDANQLLDKSFSITYSSDDQIIKEKIVAAELQWKPLDLSDYSEFIKPLQIDASAAADFISLQTPSVVLSDPQKKKLEFLASIRKRKIVMFADSPVEIGKGENVVGYLFRVLDPTKTPEIDKEKSLGNVFEGDAADPIDPKKVVLSINNERLEKDDQSGQMQIKYDLVPLSCQQLAGWDNRMSGLNGCILAALGMECVDDLELAKTRKVCLPKKVIKPSADNWSGCDNMTDTQCFSTIYENKAQEACRDEFGDFSLENNTCSNTDPKLKTILACVLQGDDYMFVDESSTCVDQTKTPLYLAKSSEERPNLFAPSYNKYTGPAGLNKAYPVVDDLYEATGILANPDGTETKTKIYQMKERQFLKGPSRPSGSDPYNVLDETLGLIPRSIGYSKGWLPKMIDNTYLTYKQ